MLTTARLINSAVATKRTPAPLSRAPRLRRLRAPVSALPVEIFQAAGEGVPLEIRRGLLLGVVSFAATVFWTSIRHLGGTALAKTPTVPRGSFSPEHPGTVFAAMHSQDWLVDHLRRDGVVKHHAVEQALRRCDRKNYVDADIPHAYIYQDSPLPIGYHETISAPHMHATCLELLREHLKPGARVLDVGSGSGYLAAAMGLMVGDEGKVIGVEKHPELAQLSVANVRRDHPELLDNGVVELRAGNVLGDALEGEEPFDAIHVGAAASSLPDVLVKKLKPGGRMVIPVGRQWEFQVMQCIDKDPDGKVHKRDLMGVRYVPLTEPGDTSWEE